MVFQNSSSQPAFHSQYFTTQHRLKCISIQSEKLSSATHPQCHPSMLLRDTLWIIRFPFPKLRSSVPHHQPLLISYLAKREQNGALTKLGLVTMSTCSICLSQLVSGPFLYFGSKILELRTVRYSFCCNLQKKCSGSFMACYFKKEFTSAKKKTTT